MSPDAIFDDPRLAAVYDPLDPDRNDLDAYAELVTEFDAQTVLDVGCGTGTLACLLARRGIDVVAVDPAGASLEVARTKPGADRVRWWHGDATTLPELAVDLATMTANVAQVFLTDNDWIATLRGIRAALRPGGVLVFETRVPEQEAWRRWNRTDSLTSVEIPGVNVVESWEELVEVTGPLVTFDSSTAFVATGEVLVSTSTLRFRSRDEVLASLAATGFVVEEVRDALDRPGRELVFVARRVS